VSEQPAARKPESLLADVGLPLPVIAALLGKQPDAVRKAVARARSKPAGKEKPL
jgi:hypothetical protein